MYISKALMNIRSDSLLSSVPRVDAPWLPTAFASFASTIAASAGSPQYTEVGGSIVFSVGDTIPDSIWNTMSSALYSVTSLRNFLATNLPNCVMDATLQSSGRIRIVNTGDSVRMLDFADNTLGHLAYAKPFNRMYLFLCTTTTVAVGTANITTAIELTPQDLQQMGATLTDNQDGTFSLVGTIAMNNISFS